MKLALIMMLSSCLYAGEFKIIGPCFKDPLLTVDFDARSESNVGQLSISLLLENNISFIGNEQGLNSIFNTPTGTDALEIINDREMLAYGWCYKVNDFEPGNYPNEVTFQNSDIITWWFGYAHYKDGQWISQCEPSYLRSPSKFCKN